MGSSVLASLSIAALVAAPPGPTATSPAATTASPAVAPTAAPTSGAGGPGAGPAFRPLSPTGAAPTNATSSATGVVPTSSATGVVPTSGATGVGAASVGSAPTVHPPAAVPDERLAAHYLALGRHLEAALEYEQRWKQYELPDDLLGAATARGALGHRAHAAAYLRELVARGAAGVEVTSRLAALERDLVAVPVVLSGPEKEGAVVVQVRHQSSHPSDVRPGLVVRAAVAPQGGAPATILLDPGVWHLAVEDDFVYTSSTLRTDVSPGPQQARELTLTLRDRAARRSGSRRMTMPGVLLVVGAGLWIGGRVEYRRNLRREAWECPGAAGACRDLVTRGLSLRSAGAGMVGASLGSVMAAIPFFTQHRKARRIMWISGASAGLAGVIAGAVGVGLSARAYNDVDPELGWTDAGYRDAVKAYGAQHTAAAFFLGLGTGLLVHSVGYLVWSSRFGRGRNPDPQRLHPRGPIAAGPGGFQLQF